MTTRRKPAAEKPSPRAALKPRRASQPASAAALKAPASISRRPAKAEPETGTQLTQAKQLRALTTRRDLVHAARTVFARDGFEHARLADIAAAAGRTRGAFYDHFVDKEDVFFAIFEDHLEDYRTTISPAIRLLPRLEDRISLLVDYLIRKTQDRQHMLLALEFKIYAIRHPRRRKRLADLTAAMCQRCAMPELEHWILAVTPEGHALTRAENLVLGSLMDGFALNRMFDPGTIDEPVLRRYLMLALSDAIV